MPELENHIDGICKHLVAVLVQDAQGFGIRGQCARADTQNKPPFGQMVEHGGMTRHQHRVHMRQIGSAGTEPNIFGRMNEAGLEHHAAGNVLHQVGQVFAHKGIVITQFIGQDDDVPVFSQSFCGAA